MKAAAKPKAKDVMKAPVTALDVEMTLRDAANVLSESGISGAPVADHRGKYVGVVSLFDIVSFLAGLETPVNEPGGFYRYSYPLFDTEGADWSRWEEQERSPARQITVGEIMTPKIITVSPDMALNEVASLMWERHIHRVFVAKKGIPIGVISTMDMIGALSGKSAARK